MSSAGQTYEDYLKSTFDCLYREGGKMMNIPLHSRITGKVSKSQQTRTLPLFARPALLRQRR